jgi:hypothetical protein
MIHFTGRKEVYNLLSYEGPLLRRSKAKERRRGWRREEVSYIYTAGVS